MSIAEPRTFRWTREQYDRIAAMGVFDGRRIELIRGELIEMTPQDSAHATAVTLAYRLAERLWGDRGVVRVQLPLALGRDSAPEPDVALVAGEPLDYVDGHPDRAMLIVEVADTSLAYDRTKKARLYADAGIEDYWIVNLVERQLEVLREPANGEYGRCRVLTAGETITPLACPDAPVSVGDLLLP